MSIARDENAVPFYLHHSSRHTYLLHPVVLTKCGSVEEYEDMLCTEYFCMFIHLIPLKY